MVVFFNSLEWDKEEVSEEGSGGNRVEGVDGIEEIEGVECEE